MCSCSETQVDAIFYTCTEKENRSINNRKSCLSIWMKHFKVCILLLWCLRITPQWSQGGHKLYFLTNTNVTCSKHSLALCHLTVSWFLPSLRRVFRRKHPHTCQCCQAEASLHHRTPQAPGRPFMPKMMRQETVTLLLLTHSTAAKKGSRG